MPEPKHVTVQIPLETLLSILDQLPEETLVAIRQKLDKRIKTLPPTIVNDSAGEFWRSEIGKFILQEADESISTEDVRQLLRKLSGSLAQDILEERGGR